MKDKKRQMKTNGKLIKKYRRHVKRLLSLLLPAVLICLLGGCGKGDGNGTKVVFHTGFGKNEIFRIEGSSCTLPEIMVYLTNTQNQYENIYGRQIWDTDLNGVTLEENVKDTVLARMAQIKTMNLLAKDRDITLTEDEKALVKRVAEEYYGTLNETEISLMDLKQDIVEQLYGEYALAEKVYSNIIKDINPEISDDEARTITVQHILIKTYTLDGTGKRVEYTDNARSAAYQKAAEILALAADGSHDFESLIAQYSEDPAATYSFGKGEMDAAFEEAAFNLGTNEISGIVESQFGYHIIKCLNTFDREETDNNKLKIVEQRKKEVFGQEYDVFVEGLTRKLNESLWDSITFIHDGNVTTSDFFDVYNRFFP